MYTDLSLNAKFPFTYPHPQHRRGRPPYKLTVDGLESQMATDHVGLFLLTKMLKPKLLAAATGSSYTPHVVSIASVTHMFGPGINFDVVERPSAEAYTSFGAILKPSRQISSLQSSSRSGLEARSTRTASVPEVRLLLVQSLIPS
jgi:NAD(P)-dependent dehydrogenase (short-subunit alcohol dehydrogenase family)